MNIDKDKLVEFIEKLKDETADGYWISETACIYGDSQLQVHVTVTKDDDEFMDKIWDLSSLQSSHNVAETE